MSFERSVAELTNASDSEPRSRVVRSITRLAPPSRHQQHVPPTVMVVGNLQIIIRLFVTRVRLSLIKNISSYVTNCIQIFNN